MLKDYKGSANSSAILQYLVGEEIAGTFIDGPYLILVMKSGDGLTMTSLGGEVTPSYSHESKQEIKARIDRRRREIQEKIEQLRGLTTFDSPDESEMTGASSSS